MTKRCLLKASFNFLASYSSLARIPVFLYSTIPWIHFSRIPTIRNRKDFLASEIDLNGLTYNKINWENSFKDEQPSLDRASSRWFSYLRRSWAMDSWKPKSEIILLILAKYYVIAASGVSYSPLICLTTNSKFIINFTFFASKAWQSSNRLLRLHTPPYSWLPWIGNSWYTQ